MASKKRPQQAKPQMRVVTMKMDDAMAEQVRQAAEREGRTVSGWMRFYIANQLKRQSAPPDFPHENQKPTH